MNFTDLLSLQDQHTLSRGVVDPTSKILREPRLLLPGMQSIGLMRIDWNNSITKDLVFCLVPPLFRNIVDNRIATSVNNPISIGTSQTGRHILGTDNTQGLTFGTKNYMTSASWSAVSLINCYNAPQYSNALMFTNFNAFGNSYIWNIGPGAGKSQLQAWSLAGSDRVICSMGDVIDKIVPVGMQLNSGVTAGTQFWYDGQKKQAPTCTQNTLSAGAYVTSLYFYPSASNLYRFNANNQFEATFIWNRAITDAEMASISADPYQIFKPA